MKHLTKIIIILALLVIMNSVAFAEPEYEDDEIVLVPKLEVNSVNELSSEKYPVTRYSFDSVKFGIFYSLDNAVKAFCNIIFFLNIWLAKMVNWLLVNSFTLDLFSMFRDVLDGIINALFQSFNPIIGLLISIAGLSIVFSLAKRQTSRSTGMIISTVLVILAAYFYTASPSNVVGFANDISKELCGGMIGGIAEVTEGKKITADDAIVNLSNMYWGTTIERPWTILQFGSLKDQSLVDDFLSKPAGSNERQQLANSMNYESFKPIGQAMRLAMVLVVTIINLAVSALVGTLSIGMIAAQFMVLISTIIAVVGFIVGLLPNRGFRVAMRGVFNIFNFMAIRFGVTLCLCLYFIITTILYKYINQYGWFGVMAFQFIAILVIIFGRGKLFGFMKTSGDSSMPAVKGSAGILDNKMVRAYAYTKVMSEGVNLYRKARDRRLEKKLRPNAERLLYKRYAEEKRNAEAIAKAKTEKSNGQKQFKPQYSDFIKNVDERTKRGFKAFRDDDIDNVVNMMKESHHRGEDPDRYLVGDITGKTDQEIIDDQLRTEALIEKTKTDLQIKEDGYQDTIDRVIRSDKKSILYNKRKYKRAKAKYKEKYKKGDGRNKPGFEYWNIDQSSNIDQESNIVDLANDKQEQQVLKAAVNSNQNTNNKVIVNKQKTTETVSRDTNEKQVNVVDKDIRVENNINKEVINRTNNNVETVNNRNVTQRQENVVENKVRNVENKKIEVTTKEHTTVVNEVKVDKVNNKVTLQDTVINKPTAVDRFKDMSNTIKMFNKKDK